jgi:Fe-S cluster biogenesis protein NfuA
MYYIGLDVHKRTISYCVKDAAVELSLAGACISCSSDTRPVCRTVRRRLGLNSYPDDVKESLDQWVRRRNVLTF